MDTAKKAYRIRKIVMAVKLSMQDIQTITSKVISLRVQIITLTTIIQIAINTNIHIQIKTKNLLTEREIKKTTGLIKLI
jgi:hypothetical protein